MSLGSSLRVFAAALFRRAETHDDMDEELRSHLRERADDLEGAGLSPAEAARRARREFGSYQKVREECRQALGTLFLESLAQDVRFGLRALRKSPGFAAVAVLTLALGIGANAAIFTLVDSFLFRPLPVRDPGQLTALAMKQGQSPLTNTFSVPDIHDLAAQTQSIFSALVGYQLGMEGLAVNGRARPILITFVTGNYFDALGIRPRLGRFISPAEGSAPGADPVLVLGYSYWQTRFGADPQVVGKKVAINGTPVTIIGVAPEGFHGLYSLVDAQGYLSLGMLTVETWWSTHDFVNRRTLRNTVVLARRRQGVSLRQAQAALQVVGRRLARQYPDDDKALSLLAFREQLARPDPDPDATMLKIAGLFVILAGLVLALACTNVANILLVRATTRQREMAVRAAHGAGRARLLRQLITENIVLALAGGVAGVVLGWWTSQGLGAVNLRADLPILLDVHFDWLVFAQSFAAVLFAAAAVSVAPALRAASGNLAHAFHDGGRTIAAGRSRLRSALVVAEIGGSLMLLIMAGLFTRSLQSAQAADLGFDPRHVLNLSLDPHEIGYTKEQGLAFSNELLVRVRALPGVQAASIASLVPMSYVSSNTDIRIPAHPGPPGEPLPLAWENYITPDYFRTMRMPLVEGRDLTGANDQGMPPVAVINQAMAARFWPGEDPLGKEFLFGSRARRARIVGIVRNSRFQGLTGPILPYFYAPLAQTYLSLETLQVRTTVPPETMTRSLRKVVAGLAPAMPVIDVETMTQSLETLQGLLVFRFGAILAAALGVLGLILAIGGVYGVISYTAAQRTHEIGIRIALGARRGDTLIMVLRQGLALVAMGIAAGLLAAALTARLVGSLLVGVSATDPATYTVVAVFLACIALLACYIPARRAVRVDPTVALRYE
jgi:predicted permease